MSDLLKVTIFIFSLSFCVSAHADEECIRKKMQDNFIPYIELQVDNFNGDSSRLGGLYKPLIFKSASDSEMAKCKFNLIFADYEFGEEGEN